MRIILWAILACCWVALFIAMVMRKRSAAREERKRDRAAWAGLVLQGLAFGLVWAVRRRYLAPIDSGGRMTELFIFFTSSGISICSAWLVVWSVRTLGRQWALAARLLENHKLVMVGPYRLVRHPIYAGMFGLMLATGLGISTPATLLAAFPLFWLGTWIRVLREDQLLREQFGDEWEDYVRRVPAFFPRLPL